MPTGIRFICFYESILVYCIRNIGTTTAGPITTELWKTIIDIQYGRVPGHPWSVLVKEEELI